MKSRLFLGVVIRQSAAVLELRACEDQALLILRYALLALDLCLDIINRDTGLHVQSDGLACECLDEDLHASAQTQHMVRR